MTQVDEGLKKTFFELYGHTFEEGERIRAISEKIYNDTLEHWRQEVINKKGDLKKSKEELKRAPGELIQENNDNDTNPEIHEKALEILKNGNPLEYIVASINRYHIGDTQAARVLVLTICCQQVKNSKGIHPALHGESGKGKSDLAKKVKFHMPPEWFIETSLSGKAPFYADIREGCTILCDDMELGEEFKQTLKRTTTNWNDVTVHTTVINGTVRRLTIPPRICWWFTSVDTNDDDQVLNREIPISVDDSTDTDEKVWARQLENLRNGHEDMTITEEVLICREIIRIIKSKLISVQAKFAEPDNIIWNNKSNRRNFDVFVDVLKACAVLNQYQRAIETKDDQDVILAQIDDFITAKDIYCGEDGQAEAQQTKLTKIELDIVRLLEQRARDNKSGFGEATIDEIQTHIGLSRSRTQMILNGNKVKGFGGLLSKIPSLHVRQETHTDVTDEVRRTRPKNIYQLDVKKSNFLQSYESIVDFTDSFKQSLEYQTFEKQRKSKQSGEQV